MARPMAGALAAFAAMTLAGCDGGSGGGGNAQQIKVTGETDYEGRLKALSEVNRGLALKRAIQDSGQRCKKVDQAGHQEQYENLSMWTARCSDSGDWALFIAPNGDVQVRKCAEMATLKLPTCRIEEAAATKAS